MTVGFFGLILVILAYVVFKPLIRKATTIVDNSLDIAANATKNYKVMNQIEFNKELQKKLKKSNFENETIVDIDAILDKFESSHKED